MKYFRSHVLVCVDPECLARGAHEVIDSLQDELVAQGLIDEVQVLVDGRVLDSFEEMEVELRAGSETALVALAKLLEADADLQPLATSKFERAVGAVRSNLDSLPAPLREHWFSAPTELLAAAGPNP